MSSATVKARIVAADAAYLKLSTDPSIKTWDLHAGTQGSDSVWTFDLSGLTPDTAYYWKIAGSAVDGQFRTPPAPGTAHSFTVAAAGDSGQPGWAEYVTGPSATSDSPAFDRIADRDPDLFIHVGDFHYRNITSGAVGDYRQAFRDVLANSRQHALYRSTVLAYGWDDHDYSDNNSDGTYSGKDAAQEAYRDYVPHWDLPADERAGGDGEIYQTFVWGRVRFVILDVRSEKSPNGATDNSSKTVLGSDQKQWFKDVLLAADEPVIVVSIGVTWIDNPGTAVDQWAAYSTERQELAEFFEDNGLTDRLILVSADDHRMRGDDGTFSQFDPDATGDGPVTVSYAPLDAGTSAGSQDAGVSHSHGIHNIGQQGYGTLDFEDDGSEVNVTMRAWQVDGESESLVFTIAKTFGGA